MTKMLAEMDVLTSADVMSLECLCEAYADKLEARTKLRMEGMFYSAGGLKRSNPAMGIIEDVDRRIWRWLTDFGMTPASRTKVRMVKSRKGVRGGEGKDTAPVAGPNGANGAGGPATSRFF